MKERTKNRRYAERRPVIIARAPRLLAAAAILVGIVAWLLYLGHDLVLSHYDAKAHLVVARRVFDSMTPGWRQIGAVWLPLPHLLHLFPTQVDLLYRTGAFGSLLSIACLGVTTWAFARLVLLITGSTLGAITSAALLVFNSNLLYLHVTPMTEPLSIAATSVAVLWLYEWIAAAEHEVPATLGWSLAAAAWTRYEAWAVIIAALCVATVAMWRSGRPMRAIVGRLCRLSVWPASAVLLFLIMSRLTTGAWFVGSEFYVPDPYYDGRPLRTLLALWWGTHRLSGYGIEIIALAAALVVALRALARRADTRQLLPLTLFAAAAVPFVAFYEGHPYRMRYMMPLVAACALFGGLAVGFASRWRPARGRPRNLGPGHSGWPPARGRPTVARRPGLHGPVIAAILIGSSLIESPPWSRNAALLEESQWDVPRSRARRSVTICLADYRGEKVLASMASLAHYMQELSHEGFRIADFVHEGNGSIWEMALDTGPAPHVGWMLVEEEAEEGDVLAQRLRRDASFARGMTRICEGGGVALYKRNPVN